MLLFICLSLSNGPPPCNVGVIKLDLFPLSLGVDTMCLPLAFISFINCYYKKSISCRTILTGDFLSTNRLRRSLVLTLKSQRPELWRELKLLLVMKNIFVSCPVLDEIFSSIRG